MNSWALQVIEARPGCHSLEAQTGNSRHATYRRRAFIFWKGFLDTCITTNHEQLGNKGPRVFPARKRASLKLYSKAIKSCAHDARALGPCGSEVFAKSQSTPRRCWGPRPEPSPLPQGNNGNDYNNDYNTTTNKKKKKGTNKQRDSIKLQLHIYTSFLFLLRVAQMR